jgi:hypothetical protein
MVESGQICFSTSKCLADMNYLFFVETNNPWDENELYTKL